MRGRNRHSSLKTIYYRSFLGLIVVPILLIFLVSLSVTRIMMERTAISNIQNAQAGIRTSLSETVREVSLQLSHLVFVNNNEVLSLAAMMDQAEPARRYDYSSRLDELFRFSAAPSQNTVSAMFFMKNGGSAYLKDEIRLSREEIEEEPWYQEALGKPDVVSVGVFDTSDRALTYSRLKKGECVLAAALSPSIQADRAGRIEMVALFAVTPLGDLIRKYNRDPLLGTTFLVDENGGLLFAGESHGTAEAFLSSLSWLDEPVGDEGIILRQDMTEPDSGRFQHYTVIASEAGTQGWKVVTCVRTGSLTESYNRIALLLFGVVGILLFLFYLFSRFYLRGIIVPVHTVVEGMKELENGNLDTHIQPAGQSEIRTMIHSFNQMVRRLKASINENEMVQQKRHQAEIQALQSQINPHFLVNTLNSIRFMAQVSRFEGIRRMAEALIKILSCSFRGNISFYTVKEELEVLDSYLYLMKIRYNDGFDVTYQIEEECLPFKVPRLILQPIVENSVVHGLSEKEEDIGHLVIGARLDGDQVCFTVEDDGRGMSSQEIETLLRPREREEGDNQSIGVENVYARLKLWFGDQCSLRMESEPGVFTRTEIRIPKRTGEEEHEQGPDSR